MSFSAYFRSQLTCVSISIFVTRFEIWELRVKKFKNDFLVVLDRVDLSSIHIYQTNIRQQIWCVCRMGSLKIVQRPHTANTSKQVNSTEQTSFDIRSVTNIRGNATECERRHLPSPIFFCRTIHVYPFQTNECIRSVFIRYMCTWLQRKRMRLFRTLQEINSWNYNEFQLK